MTFGRIMDWHVHHLVDDLGWWRRDGHMHWHRDALDFGDCVVVRAVDHLGVTANPSQVAAVALLLTSPSLHEVIHVGVTVEGMRVHHHLVGNHFGWRCRNRHWNGMRDRHVPHMSVVLVADHESLRRWCHRINRRRTGCSPGHSSVAARAKTLHPPVRGLPASTQAVGRRRRRRTTSC